MPNLNHCLDCDKPYTNRGLVCSNCGIKYRNIHETTQRLTYQIRKKSKKNQDTYNFINWAIYSSRKRLAEEKC